MPKENQSPRSESFKPLHPPEVYINRWTHYTRPEKFEEEICDLWLAPPALYNREVIHRLGLDNDSRVIEADQKILKLAFKYEPLLIYKTDIGYEPEPSWWWYYLHGIHKGTYSIDLPQTTSKTSTQSI